MHHYSDWCLRTWKNVNRDLTPKIFIDDKCSKILNFLLVLFLNKMLVIKAGIQNRVANIEDPDQTASSKQFDWVCSVCLGLFSRQHLFKILDHLQFRQSYDNFNLNFFISIK